MIIAAATAAEAIVVLTGLAMQAEIPLLTAEAAKAMIIKFGLGQAFSHLLARCEARIKESTEEKDGG